MRWNELPEECQTCIHLRAFSIYISGDVDYTCNRRLICGEENAWIQRKEESEE